MELVDGEMVKKLSDLKPAKYNPRKIADKALAGLSYSIEEFGDISGIVVNQKTGNIVAGHQRVKALQAKYGDLEIKDGTLCTPDGNNFKIRYVDWPIEKEKAANVAANNPHIAGDWTAGLGDLLGELKGFDEKLFDALNFDALLDVVPELEICSPAGEADEDDVPEIEGDPVIQPGDLILLGKHKVLCGDSTNVQHVDRLMDGKKATCTYQDPPYGVSYADKNEYLNAISRGNRIQTPIDNDHKTVPEMKQFWTDVFTLTATYLEPGGSYYFSGPQGGELMMMSIIDAGLELKHMLIWVKNNHVLGRSDYNYKHEPILYGWKPGKGHKFYGGGGEVSVWEIDKPHKSDLHPTMKPVELIERAINNSSKQGNIVLDLFLGSGSTLIACQKTNRICYGMEIAENYCEVIINRYIDYIGNQDDVKVIRDEQEYNWSDLCKN